MLENQNDNFNQEIILKNKAKLNAHYFLLHAIIYSLFVVILTIYILGETLKLHSTDSSSLRTLVTYTLVLGFIDMLFYIFKRKRRLFPINLLIIYSLNIIIDVLGENFAFYQKIGSWDVIGHIISGTFFFILGFVFLNLTENIFKANFLKVLFICLCISTTMEALWEIIEFIVDVFTNSNMTRTIDSATGIPYIGLDALRDTMEDIICSIIGSSIGAGILLIDGKNNFKNFRLRKIG
jgi:hypothetical protein